jgi:hypothetical protein
MCKAAIRACTPACAGGRTIGALAGAGLFGLAAAGSGPLADLGRIFLDACGAFTGLVVVLAVGLAWRAGAVAWCSRGTLRAAVWTCTHTQALASAGVRGYAGGRARRRLAASDVKALPVGRQGLGVGIPGAVSSPLLSGVVVPRSTALTTGSDDRPGIRVTTGPYQPGTPGMARPARRCSR